MLLGIFMWQIFDFQDLNLFKCLIFALIMKRIANHLKKILSQPNKQGDRCIQYQNQPKIAPNCCLLRLWDLQGPWTAVQGLELKLILRMIPTASLQGFLEDFAINIEAVWELKITTWESTHWHTHYSSTYWHTLSFNLYYIYSSCIVQVVSRVGL